ncbi:hypothetical protein O6H91_16G054700 [Diphasiastrum complanatum]|uniref:Uncharacterized protein n=2 Tax=Diphasiastrum complanatum TaxID=34168 RepID=A0ACC2BCF9_DIPCM|nr:hypothetical protein O6H91_16G054700 [Diphasiastrum complanatum]
MAPTYQTFSAVLPSSMSSAFTTDKIAGVNRCCCESPSSFGVCGGNWRLKMGSSRRHFYGTQLEVRRCTAFGVLCTLGMPEQAKFGAAIKSEQYNELMQKQMMNPYEYHHELGMYYTPITENLLVGSQPQSPDDIELLHQNQGVTAILNLQQDKDIEYWGIDLVPILHKCEELKIHHLRMPARDFDPDSLRRELPRAVAALEKIISDGGTVYVHCTAGLGRAPAVAIAYFFWFHDMDMETAYTFVTSRRPCGPRKEAIRGATYDLAKNDPHKAPFEDLPDHAFTDIAHWERQLIQERIRSLQGN